MYKKQVTTEPPQAGKMMLKNLWPKTALIVAIAILAAAMTGCLPGGGGDEPTEQPLVISLGTSEPTMEPAPTPEATLRPTATPFILQPTPTPGPTEGPGTVELVKLVAGHASPRVGYEYPVLEFQTGIPHRIRLYGQDAQGNYHSIPENYLQEVSVEIDEPERFRIGPDLTVTAEDNASTVMTISNERIVTKIILQATGRPERPQADIEYLEVRPRSISLIDTGEKQQLSIWVKYYGDSQLRPIPQRWTQLLNMTSVFPEIATARAEGNGAEVSAIKPGTTHVSAELMGVKTADAAKVTVTGIEGRDSQCPVQLHPGDEELKAADRIRITTQSEDTPVGRLKAEARAIGARLEYTGTGPKEYVLIYPCPEENTARQLSDNLQSALSISGVTSAKPLPAKGTHRPTAAQQNAAPAPVTTLASKLLETTSGQDGTIVRIEFENQRLVVTPSGETEIGPIWVHHAGRNPERMDWLSPNLELSLEQARPARQAHWLAGPPEDHTIDMAIEKWGTIAARPTAATTSIWLIAQYQSHTARMRVDIRGIQDQTKMTPDECTQQKPSGSIMLEHQSWTGNEGERSVEAIGNGARLIRMYPAFHGVLVRFHCTDRNQMTNAIEKAINLPGIARTYPHAESRTDLQTGIWEPAIEAGEGVIKLRTRQSAPTPVNAMMLTDGSLSPEDESTLESLDLTSLDEDIASVSEDGKRISGNKPGSTQLILQGENGSTKRLTVEVSPR